MIAWEASVKEWGEWLSAQGVLRGAKAEVEEAVMAEGGFDVDRLLEQLVPYAEVMARIEGHGDLTLVMERELDL